MEDKDKKQTENAVPTSVNDQITDAVTQSNVKAVGEAPAIALGNAYQSAAHSTGILFENAVNSQQQQNSLGQAAANQGVMQIYGIDTGADEISIAQMLNASEKVEHTSEKNEDKTSGTD